MTFIGDDQTLFIRCFDSDKKGEEIGALKQIHDFIVMRTVEGYRPLRNACVLYPKNGNYGGPYFWKIDGNASGLFGRGHPGNAANLIFLDGHAKSMELYDVWSLDNELPGNGFYAWDEYFNGGRNLSNSL